jgi:hypothetical protein
MQYKKTDRGKKNLRWVGKAGKKEEKKVRPRAKTWEENRCFGWGPLFFPALWVGAFWMDSAHLRGRFFLAPLVRGRGRSPLAFCGGEGARTIY